ncbi:hypothetical protein [Amycolatopsis sp. MtRt-6]|uniref:hypothetical protein n=1 Tax=Amycolatopsis sp. MtRt-6 TaxID=2792782 RepID=UPI0027DBDFE4|nr:hypothetical protein [Amycolatopsis sp. MtRt-6]
MWIGVGGAVLVAVAVVVRAKAKSRVLTVLASAAVSAGWLLVALFLVEPLVPGPVLAVVLLAGITVGIFLAAVVGGRRGTTRPPGASTSAGSPRRPGREPGPE